MSLLVSPRFYAKRFYAVGGALGSPLSLAIEGGLG